MRKLTLLAAAAAVTFAAPAFAQTAPAPTPAPQAAPAEEATSPEEAAFEAKADAFGERMQAMMQEMQTAVSADGADAAKKKADLDAIQARYQPEVDAFVDALQVFAGGEIAAAPEDKKAEMQAKLDQGLPQLRNLPAMMRAQLEGVGEAPAAPAPAATAPVQ